MDRQARYVVVMGVSGSGKTEIARRVATETNCPWLDADDHHPANNVEHMRRGQPLNDEMRWPWLEAVSRAAQAKADQCAPGNTANTIFIACSALKRSYRDVLGRNLDPVTFVFLDGTRDVIKSRLERRVGHFMPSALLDSQLADLEPPGPDENCVTVFVDAPIDAVVSTVITRLKNCENGSSSFVKDNITGKTVCQGEER
ncbi:MULTISPECIES: gluconokinase [Thalassospira]|uniref:Gluconokinase n=2 Tax=Thalassospira TaxID=168934 RepID=A0A367W2R7_9PROT|nr:MULTISPECIES: gluconokinase [Thalassospira]MDG4718392.1 gluconokinase [Thalassospira sp. FZY0004]RCK34687.1 gluconate kinase [Thalassospira profundimaris]